MSKYKHHTLEQLETEKKRAEHYIGQLTGKLNNEQIRLNAIRTNIETKSKLKVDEAKTMYVVVGIGHDLGSSATNLFYTADQDEADKIVKKLNHNGEAGVYMGNLIDISGITDDGQYLIGEYDHYEVDPVVMVYV